MTVELELAPGPSFNAVGRLVVGGLGARLGLGVERITDLQQALHAAFLQPASGETLVLTMTPSSEDLQVRLGPFDGAVVRRPAVHRVVSALVDEMATHQSGDDVWFDMRITRSARTPAG